MRRLSLIAVIAALLAGCGGSETTAPAPETVEGETAQTQTETAAETETGTETEQEGGEGEAASGDATAGEQVYAQNGCGSCHAFEPAGSNGQTGPALDDLEKLAEDADRGSVQEFTSESILQPNAYVEQGYPEGVMPAYEQLEGKQLDDLVAFLTQS